MKNIMKKGLMALTASLLLLAASGTAHAVITAGGSTIHNTATLAFTGGSTTASVNVTVDTIASAPTVTVDTTAQSVNANGSFTYTYTVTNKANGTDTFGFSASSADADVTAGVGLDVNGSGGLATSLVLGGSVTSQPNTVANTIVIPAGSETNLQDGDIINVGGFPYTIAVGGIAQGTIANPGAVELPTVITLVPGASPQIAIGAIAAGQQIGEIQTFTVVVAATVATIPGTNGTHTVNLQGATTAVTQGPAGAAVNYSTNPATVLPVVLLGGAQTVTTVLSPNVTLLKEVRNVTQGVVGFAATATAQSGDILEYRLTATVVVGANATAASITDEVPAFTSYVPGSAQLNGGLVADGVLPGPGALPTTLVNGGLPVNSVGALPGIINLGSPAVVLFQVTVN